MKNSQIWNNSYYHFFPVQAEKEKDAEDTKAEDAAEDADAGDAETEQAADEEGGGDEWDEHRHGNKPFFVLMTIIDISFPSKSDRWYQKPINSPICYFLGKLFFNCLLFFWKRGRKDSNSHSHIIVPFASSFV